MRKVLFTLIVGAVSSMSFAGNGYFENLIDPKTGMVDCDKLEPVKRPEGYFAGKLIEDAGLRGYRVGDAQVSEKHCGFVVNRGEATAKDVAQLISDVQNRVMDEFGVKLEPEVRMIGFE